MTPMFNPVFSVTEFNEVVSNHLALLGEVTVEGEISEFKVSQGKWIYLTIKDKGASVQVFATSWQIRNYNSFDVGMLVKVTGTAGLYKKTARFSLNATSIVPSGEGALLAAYEKLKAMLEKEGLFAPERKRPLPMFPQTVGLLTAKGSQAYNDFVKVTEGRIGGVKILFYPVQVQGADAVESVIEGIRYFNQKKNVELVVITRGGGSLEDLAAFNDEQLVRQIFASNLLVVAAIGHEGDVSLAELAADLRGSTPSNAAELIFRDREELTRDIENMVGNIEMYLNNKIENIDRGVSYEIAKIERHFDQAFRSIHMVIEAFGSRLLGYTDVITREEERVDFLTSKLQALDPTSVLKRGFSIIKTKSGEIIKSIDQIDKGQELITSLSDGTIESKVINKHKGMSQKELT